MKWVESLQDYTFTIKNMKGIANKVEDALRRRFVTILEVQLESMGIESLREMYVAYEDFK